MSPTAIETEKQYFTRMRREAWQRSAKSWPEITEAQWCEEPYHWHLDTKVYHSYADYVDD